MEKTILIIGGAFQNKLDATLKLFNLSFDDVSSSPFCDKIIVDNFNDFYKNTHLSDDEILNNCLNKIIICTEIGSGIVPLDKDDRAFREKLGRFSCLLAEKSHVVIRVQCGIPQIIKGELNYGA